MKRVWRTLPLLPTSCVWPPDNHNPPPPTSGQGSLWWERTRKLLGVIDKGQERREGAGWQPLASRVAVLRTCEQLMSHVHMALAWRVTIPFAMMAAAPYPNSDKVAAHLIDITEEERALFLKSWRHCMSLSEVCLQEVKTTLKENEHGLPCMYFGGVGLSFFPMPMTVPVTTLSSFESYRKTQAVIADCLMTAAERTKRALIASSSVKGFQHSSGKTEIEKGRQWTSWVLMGFFCWRFGFFFFSWAAWKSNEHR